MYIWLFARANIYMVIRLGEYIWLFARGNVNMVIRPGEYIYGYSPGRMYIWLFARANIYMVIRLGEYIYGYLPGRIYIWLFARANIYGFSPGRMYIWLFARPKIFFFLSETNLSMDSFIPLVKALLNQSHLEATTMRWAGRELFLSKETLSDVVQTVQFEAMHQLISTKHCHLHLCSYLTTVQRSSVKQKNGYE